MHEVHTSKDRKKRVHTSKDRKKRVHTSKDRKKRVHTSKDRKKRDAFHNLKGTLRICLGIFGNAFFS